MNADLSDHPFSPESIAFESGAPSYSERAWLRWVATVERLLGHDLDGNDVDEAGCGYSLDDALAWFEYGDSPTDYVEEIKSRPRYASPVQS